MHMPIMKSCGKKVLKRHIFKMSTPLTLVLLNCIPVRLNSRLIPIKPFWLGTERTSSIFYSFFLG